MTASFLAALFLGERLTPGALVGAALLLCSLAILSLGDLATRRKASPSATTPAPD